MRLRSVLPVLCAALVLGAARAPEESWGKPGVSFQQYRQDAVECARVGLGTDIVGTEPVKALTASSTLLDNALTRSGTPDPNTIGIIKQSARVEQRFAQVKGIMEDGVAACLRRAGYSRFRLTDDQRKALGKLKLGSPERRRYLYTLASDAQVLKTQAI